MDDFLLFFVVGLLAQLVDGALGMAYGVISTTVLLSFGVTPAAASAATHSAELFTTAASGTAHIVKRNIDWKLFRRLVPFGILGGLLGTYILTSVDASFMRPLVAAYLAVIGIVLLGRSFRSGRKRKLPLALVPPVGAAGGFLDAAGGGGWGPIVTTGLLGGGGEPRLVIGTVNTAEFLVTLSVSLAFLFALLTGHWEEADALAHHATAVAGLVAGGVVAAPFAAHVVRILRPELLLRLVGTLICVLAVTQIWGLLAGS